MSASNSDSSGPTEDSLLLDSEFSSPKSVFVFAFYYNVCKNVYVYMYFAGCCTLALLIRGIMSSKISKCRVSLRNTERLNSIQLDILRMFARVYAYEFLNRTHSIPLCSLPMFILQPRVPFLINLPRRSLSVNLFRVWTWIISPFQDVNVKGR